MITVPLSEMEFRLIRDLLHERCGMYFKDERRSFLEMKLQTRILACGLDSFWGYYNVLKDSRQGEEELVHALCCVTNNESYFFRELTQLKLVGDVILPAMQALRSAQERGPITIVSAGCSTGEEPYTLAMLLSEAGYYPTGREIAIIGMDISERALGLAQAGRYYQRSFRMTPPQYVTRWFTNGDESYEIKSNIRRLVSFRRSNIVDPGTWAELGTVEVILCRNVLIYFSEPKVEAVLAHFYEALRPGGYLLLGHSETLTGVRHAFTGERMPETIVYRKPLPVTTPSTRVRPQGSPQEPR